MRKKQDLSHDFLFVLLYIGCLTQLHVTKCKSITKSLVCFIHYTGILASYFRADYFLELQVDLHFN